MRVVTYGGTVSLDGFLAGPDNALDKRICLMGRGEPAQSRLSASLVDEIGPRVTPSLVECRALGGGCILATYTVRKRLSAITRRRARA